MTVSLSWTSPAAGGTLDLSAGTLVTEAHWDAIISNLLVLGGTDGNTKSGGLTVTGGTVGIGGSGTTNAWLAVVGSGVIAGTSQFGIVSQPVFPSSATTEASAVLAQVGTAAGAFTVGTGAAVHAFNPIKGSGSAITSAYGVLIDSITAGGTNNYGIAINAPSGGSGNNLGLSNLGGALVNGGSTPLGFHGTSPVAKQTVTGAKGGNAALTSLLAALAAYGLVVDSST